MGAGAGAAIVARSYFHWPGEPFYTIGFDATISNLFADLDDNMFSLIQLFSETGNEDICT